MQNGKEDNSRIKHARKFFTAALLALIATISFGCAAGSSLDLSIIDEYPHYVSRGARPAPVALAPLKKSAYITIDKLRKYVAGANPRIRADALRILEARGRIRHAELWPNPSLKFTDEARNGDTSLSISQLLDIGGKISARTKAAGAQADVIVLTHQALLLITIRDAEHQFYTVFHLQEEVKLASKIERITTELARLAKAKRDAGTIVKTELLKFEVASENARREVENYRAEHEAACRMLDGFLGASNEITLGVNGSWLDTPLPMKEANLYTGLTRHPTYLAKDSSVRAAKLALQRENAEAWPDLTAIFIADRAKGTDENEFGFGFSIPIPIFNVNQGKRAQASAAIKRAKEALVAEQITLKTGLAAALAVFKVQTRHVNEYENVIIPKVEEVYKLSQAAYAGGKATNLDVLDSLLLLVRTKRVYLKYQTRLARSATQIKYLSGYDAFKR